MIATYKLLGIILVATGIVDIVILPKILAKAKGDANTTVLTAIVWIMAVVTMIAGLLCFLGIFGIF
jgi:hypothetical protein